MKKTTIKRIFWGWNKRTDVHLVGGRYIILALKLGNLRCRADFRMEWTLERVPENYNRYRMHCKVDCLDDVKQWCFESTCSTSKKSKKSPFEMEHYLFSLFEERDLDIRKDIVRKRIECIIRVGTWTNIREDLGEEEMWWWEFKLKHWNEICDTWAKEQQYNEEDHVWIIKCYKRVRRPIQSP